MWQRHPSVAGTSMVILTMVLPQVQLLLSNAAAPSPLVSLRLRIKIVSAHPSPVSVFASLFHRLHFMDLIT